MAVATHAQQTDLGALAANKLAVRFFWDKGLEAERAVPNLPTHSTAIQAMRPL